MTKRVVFKRNINHSFALKKILQSLFVTELIKPSKCVWLISPWISNLNVIDNRSGGFIDLNPDWPNTEISMAQIVRYLLQRDTTIVIATRIDEYSKDFIDIVKKIACEENLENNLKIKKDINLHTKGILTDSFCLLGSMNLTFSGININDEQITIDNDETLINKIKLEWHNAYGGVLDASN